MPRIARLNMMVEDGVYHIMSRTVLERYFDDYEKDMLLKIIQHYTSIYFAKVYGFCVMGNHFHLIVQMQDGNDIPDSEIVKRFEKYKKWCSFAPCFNIHDEQTIPKLRKKWSNLSDLIKDIKLNFTRFYNGRHERKGFLWGGRFKNVLLQKGDALINCMAYIDLNPIRAALVDVPEDYRWSSMYYHVVKKNKQNWLSLDFIAADSKKDRGIKPFKSKKEALTFYREYLYDMGKEYKYQIYGGEVSSAHKIPEKEYKKAEKQRFKYSYKERLMQRCRYFSDSLIIGSHEFVECIHSQYKKRLLEKRKRRFPRMKGFEGIYSMRELRKDVA